MKYNGAGEGNRTLIKSLEGSRSTVELHPQRRYFSVFACVVNRAAGMVAPMSLVLLQGGRVVDPANNRDEIADVLLSDGKIQSIAPNLTAPDSAEVIDCQGQVVCPGLIDLHDSGTRRRSGSGECLRHRHHHAGDRWRRTFAHRLTQRCRRGGHNR